MTFKLWNSGQLRWHAAQVYFHSVRLVERSDTKKKSSRADNLSTMEKKTNSICFSIMKKNAFHCLRSSWNFVVRIPSFGNFSSSVDALENQFQLRIGDALKAEKKDHKKNRSTLSFNHIELHEKSVFSSLFFSFCKHKNCRFSCFQFIFVSFWFRTHHFIVKSIVQLTIKSSLKERKIHHLHVLMCVYFSIFYASHFSRFWFVVENDWFCLFVRQCENGLFVVALRSTNSSHSVVDVDDIKVMPKLSSNSFCKRR